MSSDKDEKVESQGSKAEEGQSQETSKEMESSKDTMITGDDLVAKLAQLNALRNQAHLNSQVKEHKFWNFQPVPKLDEKIEDTEQPGPIDPIKTIADIQKDPYKLADGFEWSNVDLNDEKSMLEVYNLLNENYVEDDDNMFRFDYSAQFIKWALQPPGYVKDWHIAVRVSKTGKMVAFITGIPATIAIYDSVIKMAEINFLCVHKKLRDKRLAPILIREVTRRVNLTGIFQATYTAGKVLPKPIAQCRYYHRSLNPKKLVEVGFSHLAPRMTIARTIKLYQLPDRPSLYGIRPMEAKDVVSTTKLLNNYLKQFGIKSIFDKEEVAHWLLPRENIINSYVIVDSKTNEVTDLCSFYTLPSTVIGNPKHKSLKAAYSYYNVATSTSLVNLMRDCLVFAKNNNFDVFNCLDIMHNDTFLKDLKFGKGDGNLQYYLYNWRCAQMNPQKVGLVLL